MGDAADTRLTCPYDHCSVFAMPGRAEITSGTFRRAKPGSSTLWHTEAYKCKRANGDSSGGRGSGVSEEEEVRYGVPQLLALRVPPKGFRLTLLFLFRARHLIQSLNF